MDLSNNLFLHRTDELNPGDHWSCPKHYFPELQGDVYDVNKESNFDKKYDGVILGGGSIINGKRDISRISQLINKSKSKNNFIWGSHFIRDIPQSFYNKFKLIGVRRYQKKYGENKHMSFLPCASVMHKVFDKEYKIKYPVSIISHFKRPLPKLPINTYYHTVNKPNNIESIVKIIGESETVISNSYHAVYWSMIMNKRTICFTHDESKDNKLNWFKHKPIMCRYNIKNRDSHTFDRKMLLKDYSYKYVKQEYRDLNLKFYKKVIDEYKNSNDI